MGFCETLAITVEGEVTLVEEPMLRATRGILAHVFCQEDPSRIVAQIGVCNGLL
jgi:hypothetical protein